MENQMPENAPAEFEPQSADGAPAPQSAEDGPDQAQRIAAAITALDAAGRRGANWYFWVAGLSLVNSLILLSGGDTFFVIGLGVTLLADVIASQVAQQSPDIATTVKVIAFGFDLLVALFVAGFGWLSRKRILAVFGIGMFLYLLDGLLFVLFQDWMSAGFHAFALFCMWKGLSAYRQLGALERALQAAQISMP
jgi:hypothetical protein